jgi:hypothetical protein
MSDTVSVDSIKAQMPHPVLTRVLGEPTHKQLKLLLCKLTANLMAVSCPWEHNKGHLRLLQVLALYLAQNGASFDIPPAKPPLYPIVPACATAHQCKKLRAQNNSARKAWTTYRLVRAITRNQFAATINGVFYSVLDYPIKGLNGINLRLLVQHIATTHAQIASPTLTTTWPTSTRGLTRAYHWLSTQGSRNTARCLPLMRLYPSPRPLWSPQGQSTDSRVAT